MDLVFAGRHALHKLFRNTNSISGVVGRCLFRCLVLSGLLYGTTAHAQTPPTVTLRNVIGGFSLPVEMVTAGDGTGRIFIVEQRGRIKIVEGVHTANPSIRATPFLDVSSVVSQTGSERGLLGLAFHPQYQTLGLFYIFYTRANDGALVVARVSRDANNPNLANAASRQDVIVIPHPNNSNHNGGKIAFDRLGYLVIGTGDGGGGDDPDRNSQNRGNLLGKLLRINVGSAPGYTIPPSNPYVGNTCANGRCPEIWQYGLRNPWKFSFDRLRGDLYIGDVGQNNVEEINFSLLPDGSEVNYGWAVFEGNNCYIDTYFGVPGACNGLANYLAPIAAYNHNDTGGFAVTGGYVYRGQRSAPLRGYYIYGDYVSRRLFAALPALVNGGLVWNSWILKEPDAGVSSISSFGEDEAGELYLLDYGNGRIVAIDGPGPRAKRVVGDLAGNFSFDYAAELVYASSAGSIFAKDAQRPDVAPQLLVPGGFGWTLTHMGDLNGDGKTDLFWRNTDGTTVAWLMNGTTALNARTLLPANSGWSIHQLADLNGDGRDDIIWRHTDGTITAWLMDGLSIAGTGALLGPGTSWTITHTGDFNGDGKADLLWRNGADGTTTAWLMNGTTISSGTVLLGANNSWQVSHVADLNGDSKSDVLWRNADGTVAAWLMNGTAISSAAVLLGANALWRVAHIADFNGDGKADLLWRHESNGSEVGWLMNGTTLTDAAVINASGPLLRTVQIRDFSGDGKADLLLRREDDGSLQVYRMDGLKVNTSYYLTNSASQALPVNQ